MRMPLVRAIVSQTTAQISGGRTLLTWNDLLSTFPGMLGGKTGHTSAAGWSEIAAARRGGVSIYATLIGSPDRGRRNADLTRLLDWGFSQYVRARPVVKGRAYAEARLAYGRSPLKLIAAGSLAAPFRAGLPVVRRVVFPDVVSLPVSRGQSLGKVRIYQRGRLVGAVPLLASRSVGRPGVAGRAGWYARRTLHHMAGWFS